MNRRQMELFERAVEFGFNKPEAEFSVKFREVTLRWFLRGFKRQRRHHCKKEGCGALLKGLKRFCREHEFTEMLGFDLEAWKLEHDMN